VQLAGVQSAHAEEVSSLHQEIAQHQKKHEEQSELLVQMSEERALLKSQQRQNSETIAEQRGTIDGLQGQVQESKRDAARVQQEYDTYRQQTARGQGWREALQVKLAEVRAHG
jgi:molecular chaperone GrpE (heat shock protein)